MSLDSLEQTLQCGCSVDKAAVRGVAASRRAHETRSEARSRPTSSSRASLFIRAFFVDISLFDIFRSIF